MAVRIWEVTADMWETALHYLAMKENQEISEAGYIDQLRSLGFPGDISPGDEVKIRIRRPVMSVPTRKVI